jgi:hypothetical protein
MSEEVFVYSGEDQERVFRELLPDLRETHSAEEVKSYVSTGELFIKFVRERHLILSALRSHPNEGEMSLEYTDALRRLASHNKTMRVAVEARKKRAEWDSRPETGKKKLERATRSTTNFIVHFVVVFGVVTGAMGSIFAIASSQLLASPVPGFVLAAVIAVPLAFQVATTIAKQKP